MTPDEKAKAIVEYYQNIRGGEHVYKKADLLALITEAIREAGPREVSEDELQEIALRLVPQLSGAFTELKTRDRQIGLQFFREAMRLNAIAKLESLWPSENEAFRMLQTEFPDNLMSNCWDGGLTMFRLLKSHVLGGEK